MFVSVLTLSLFSPPSVADSLLRKTKKRSLAAQTTRSDLSSKGLSYDGYVWDFEAEDASSELLLGQRANDLFGFSIAMHESKMVVGAIGVNNSIGTVYVYYRHQHQMWILDEVLSLEYPVANDQFGCAVAIYDYTVVVGANRRNSDDGYITDAGAAYIYEKKSGRWKMAVDLTPDDSTTQDYFGSSVAIYENTTVVGCWGCDAMGSFSGAAYVYSLWQGEWQFNEKIFANDGSRYNWFGVSIDVYKGLIVVGATGVASGSVLDKTGAAYVFCDTYDDKAYDGHRFKECAELLPGDGQDGDNFGASVAVQDGIIVVGAPKASYKSIDEAGAAYMYYQDKYQDFHFLQKMNAYKPSRDGHYGNSVDIDQGIVVVGGYNASGEGSIYIYGEEYELSEFDRNTNAKWQLAFIKSAESEAKGDFYGYAVCVMNKTVAVGSYGMMAIRNVRGAEVQLSQAGGVYTYQAGMSRIPVPHRLEKSHSSSSWVAWVSGVSAVLVLGIGAAGYVLYSKRYHSDDSHDRAPISDWLPSSFSKAFGAEGNYSATSLDSSHGSSSHGMIESAKEKESAARSQFDGVKSKLFEDEDEEQQMLDDSLARFQLKRQNRISLKKKTTEESK